MRRSFLLFFAATLLLCACSVGYAIQDDSAVDLVADPLRGPGGYLSWIKLLLVAVVFLIWVKLTDWINRDGQVIGKDIDLPPHIWNPISIVSFLAGFWSAISIPVFLVGFPVLLLLAFGPFAIYFLIRRSKFLETPSLKNKLLSGTGDGASAAAPLPQDDGVPIKFTPAGDDSGEQQKNLIRARQAQSFTAMKNMLHKCVRKRAEVLMLDYTRDRVNSQMMVDGAWHSLPVQPRQVGDSMLVALKNLAGLNQADRKSRQVGRFGANVAGQKTDFELITQGIKTGERVQLKISQKRKTDFTLPEVGMWPEMIKAVVEASQKNGLIIVSAPPRHGLTTTWRALLGAVDRITRDWVGVIDQQDLETGVENIILHHYDKQAGQTPETILRKVLLSQPDALALSEIPDSSTLDAVVAEALNQDRTVVTRVQAKSAAEALLRMYALAGDKSPFAHTVNCVLGQKLARRLCDDCKVPVQVKPEMIKKLGGDPRKTRTLYNAYRLPPVEQRVDENGKPVEMFPCKTCGDIGYIGRISIFEMIRVTQELRVALLKQPKLETIRKLATSQGDLPMLQQGYRLALLGITSVAEVQRVMKS